MATTEAEEEPKTHPGGQSAVAQGFENVSKLLVGTVSDLGGVASLGFQIVRWAIRPPYRVASFFSQLDFVGVGSTFLVCLTGTFTGMVFAHQSARAFELFNAESMVGPTVALTVTREL
ncbi:MAG TPA: ABC transporter permease, partial [Myxococcaceae bacterium]